jgi:type I restriction enzyme S subunit
LAAAFRGDLTADWREQNPDVEPAEALLERIRVERRKRWEEAELEKMRAKGKEPKNDTWKAKYKPLPSVDVDQLPRIHEGWCWMTPDELSKSIPNALTIGPFGSNLKVSDYQEEGVPLVFVREIRAEHFGDEKTKYVSSQKADELKSHSVKSGDLLITKMGDPPGDTAVYPLDRPLAIITADCIKWSPEPQLTSSEFLKYWLRSDIAKSFIFSETKGVAQQKLSLKRFRSIPLPVPSLPEQKEILLRVRANFQLLQNIEDTLQSLEQDSDQLDQSILAKAFRGELVPQDPTDEPAAVLLARIRAERDKLNAQHKSKKPATRRKKANP